MLAVTAIATAVSVHQGSADLERELLTLQQQAGADTADSLQQLFANADRFLQSTASLLVKDDFDPQVDKERMQEVLDPVLAHGQVFSGLYIVDRAGTVLVARPGGSDTAGTIRIAGNEHGPQLVLGATEHPAFACVPIAVSRELETPEAPFYLVGFIDVNEIEDMLFAGRRPDAEAAFVAAGSVIAATHPEFSEPVVGDHRSLLVATAGQRGDDGALVTRQPVTSDAHVVMVGSPDTLRALRANLIEDALATAVLLALTGVVLGAWFARQATQPLQRLQAATRAMAAGRLDTRITADGSAEFHGLARDFNQMAAHIQTDRNALLALRADLERRVQERTQEVRQQKQDMELFFYTVAHDIKNPAIAVRGYSELVEDGLGEKDIDVQQVRRLVGRIAKSGENLERLVREVLLFAQAERAHPNLDALDVGSVMRAIVDEQETAAARRGIRLTLHGDSLPVVSDADRVRHIVTNLVQNAIKYMPDLPDRRVAVAWNPTDDDMFTIRVSDNGAGIPKDLWPHLFRPFTRHVRDTVGTEGTGLGLSIVDRMTRSLGGTVRYETTVGHGTTFWVTLPRRPDASGQVPPWET